MMLMPRWAVQRVEIVMYRKPVNKQRSASKFRKNVSKTKAINLRVGPMRGGIRL